MKFEITVEIDDEVVEELATIFGLSKEKMEEYIKNIYIEYTKKVNEFYRRYVDLVYASNEAESSEILENYATEILKTLFEVDKKVCEKLRIFEFEKEGNS